MSTIDEIIDYAPKAFFTFQFLEETIRQYLLRCEGMTAQRLRGITKYNWEKNIKEYDKMSLGRLVEQFSRFNDSSELIKKIKNITKDRNFIAHQLYLELYNKGDPKTEVELKLLLDRTVQVHNQAKECMLNVWKEVEKIEKNFESKKTK